MYSVHTYYLYSIQVRGSTRLAVSQQSISNFQFLFSGGPNNKSSPRTPLPQNKDAPTLHDFIHDRIIRRTSSKTIQRGNSINRPIKPTQTFCFRSQGCAELYKYKPSSALLYLAHSYKIYLPTTLVRTMLAPGPAGTSMIGGSTIEAAARRGLATAT